MRADGQREEFRRDYRRRTMPSLVLHAGYHLISARPRTPFRRRIAHQPPIQLVAASTVDFVCQPITDTDIDGDTNAAITDAAARRRDVTSRDATADARMDTMPRRPRAGARRSFTLERRQADAGANFDSDGR